MLEIVNVHLQKNQFIIIVTIFFFFFLEFIICAGAFELEMEDAPP